MAKKSDQAADRAEQAGKAVAGLKRVPRLLLGAVAGLVLWNVWLTSRLNDVEQDADDAADDARRALNRANAAYDMAER